MDTTIRNLDSATYRRLKARAALEGRTIGEALNDAMRLYLDRHGERDANGARVSASRSLGDSRPTPTDRHELRATRVRQAWRASKADPEIRTVARDWLARHPSREPAIDELWAEALEGRGPLHGWLEGVDGALSTVDIPLRALLSSHPFVTYLRCSIRETSAT